MRKCFLLLLCFMLFVGAAAAEPQQLQVGFPSTVGSKPLVQQATMDDAWFAAPSDTYQHELAKLSISMAVASFRDVLAPLEESDHYLISFFEQAGFEQYRAYGYSEATSANTISNAIAMRHMTDDQGDYVLLAIPVCGQGYGDEWMSNFTIDAGDTHTGFLNAAQIVRSRLSDYIQEQGLADQRLKIWGTGFSRAAAVSNLLGQMLLEDPAFEQNNIFIYTYGTPNTTKKPTPYPQIKNICGSFDPVPKIPFADWGFSKNGVTYYLPALETDDEYPRDMVLARQVYRDLMGSSENFASLAERNWLVGQVLELLYEFLPESSIYSEGYQAAVIAAYGTKGSILDKLNAMLRALDEHHEDTADVAHVRDELMTLLSMGVTDTVNVLTGNGGSSVWYDLLSSGTMLAHEHFPEVYLSWIFSTDDIYLLYGQDSRFARLVLTGDVDVRITDGETVLMDGDETKLAVSRLQRQMFISLPAGSSYHVVVTARSDTRVNVAFSNASINFVSMALSSINPLTLRTGEFVTVEVPDCHELDGELLVKLNDHQELTVYGGEYGSSYAELLAKNGSATAITEEMRYLVNSAVIMFPWLICSTVMVLYALSILVKRLIRGRVNDQTICQRPGRILLLIAAVLAGMTAVNVSLMVAAQVRSAETVMLTNRTLQRASELLGLGTYACQVSQAVIYAITSLLCVRAVNHQFSRIRLARLSLVLLVLDIMTLFLGRVFDSITVSEVMIQLVPILSIAGLTLSISKDDPKRTLGKRWLPLSRTILMTAVLFFVRQSYVIIFGTTALPAVLLKALSGLPVLLLAVLLWKQRRTSLSLMTMLAIACYFAANTVINLSMPIALFIYTVGHCLLVFSYLKAQPRLSLPRILFWVLVALFFEAQLFIYQRDLGVAALAMGCLYIAALVGIPVTAQKISKRVQLGSVLFIISNQILSITLMFPGDFLLESVELLLYYIAVIIMAADPNALGIPADLQPTMAEN